MFGGRLGMTELIIILAICLLIFGGKKIPEVAKGLGEGIRNFKKGLSDVEKKADPETAGTDETTTHASAPKQAAASLSQQGHNAIDVQPLPHQQNQKS